jgi:hypothetical protein
MNDDVRIFEASAKRRSGGHSRNLLAIKRIDHQNGGRRVGLFEHRVTDANAIEHMKDIGSELDAIADGAERRRAFEHAHCLSVTRRRKRGRKSAKAAADDEDRALRAHIGLTSSSFSSVAHGEWAAALEQSRKLARDVNYSAPAAPRNVRFWRRVQPVDATPATLSWHVGMACIWREMHVHGSRRS